MALSAQIGYTEKYAAVKKVKLMRKLTMLRVGNTYNRPLQQLTLQSGLETLQATDRTGLIYDVLPTQLKALIPRPFRSRIQGV